MVTTTQTVSNISPDLLRNEIDERLIKIRPTATPIDQISRWGGFRSAGSMTVDYSSIDTKATRSTVTSFKNPQGSKPATIAHIGVENPEIFGATETILIPEISVDGKMLVLYVTRVLESGELEVVSVNNPDKSGNLIVPELDEGLTLIRMGRAAAELDVQTAQFEAIPKKETNFCQIFKSQIEESTYLRLANKEVGWTFSDQEEVAVIDMRMGMERNFLFGAKARITDPVKHEEVLLTGGIWNQTDNTFQYRDLTDTVMVSLARQAFSGQSGSTRKILIGGTGFVEKLHALNAQRVISAGEKITKWGIDFTQYITKFGTLYILASEVFDECGHENDAMIIDPEYITKYCHVPFSTERLDLRTSGIRNTEAIVITEASCLVLRYPSAHLKVICK